MATMYCPAQQVELAKDGASVYRIYLPVKPARTETKAAAVLQDYFFRVTGARLPIETVTQKKDQPPGFFIGHLSAGVPADGFTIHTTQKNILILGNSKGALYGVYDFIEKYLGCRKWDAGPAYCPWLPTLQIPAVIAEIGNPLMQYREVYLPPAFNDEYLDWHKLQRFESLWGLWGHSFYKLVPPSVYFRSHPEYFSLVYNKRVPLQLCLSNAAVVRITVDNLRKLIKDNPDVPYWSISPNDDIGNCECDNCKKLDDADGGPQGSLIHFVNAVAAHFPDKTITTLAYGYSARATVTTRVASNVVIMLSSIDAYRSKPLATEQSAAAFRNNLARWKEKASQVFIWDYCTQFTNYLTPFPVINTFKPNIDFFIQQGVTGVFEQGSGETYSDMAELKAYVCAKLLWDPSANADNLVKEFLAGYYGKAVAPIAEYLSLLQKNIISNRTDLDIYGNPVNDHTGYLSPAGMEAYSLLMDKAEQLTENDPVSLKRVQALRLTQEYVYLQQAKFYGKDPHGIFVKDPDGRFITRRGLPPRVERFTAMSTYAGVKEFSEGGIPPAKYAAQWEAIFNTGPTDNLAANAQVKLAYPFTPEYPSKRERTLVDESPGYEDFSYNWLCFYGVPMEAVVDMGSVKNAKAISMHFLEDARHWIFRPASVSVETSMDGIHYKPLPPVNNTISDEDYTLNFMPFRFAVNDTIRYIRVKAANWPSLPSWRYHKSKRPMIACDEIWVE
jgi:hypothetical protein